MSGVNIDSLPSSKVNSFQYKYGAWAVVTGASDGIGREFARELALRKLNIVLVARRSALLEALAVELRVAHSVECRVISADLALPKSSTPLFDETTALDVGLLVASAGFGTSGPFVLGKLTDEQDMLAVNCGAVLDQTAHFAKRFAERGRGGIVLLSSVVAFQGTPGSAHYGATKAYIQSLAEGLREELKESGVDVVAAAPGPINTGFAARAKLNMAQSLEPDVVAKQTLAALGRHGTVRPGWLSKLLGWSLATAPRWMRVKIMGKVMAGMTSSQRSKPPVANRSAT
jgi:uncharacterized protein